MAATPNMDKKWGQGWQTTGSCVPTIVCCQFEHFRVVVSSISLTPFCSVVFSTCQPYSVKMVEWA